jgi:hypothetical protein
VVCCASSLSNNNFGPIGAEELLPALAQLSHLEVLEYVLSSLALEHISICVIDIVSLWFSLSLEGNELGQKGLQTLMSALQLLTNLRHLKYVARYFSSFDCVAHFRLVFVEPFCCAAVVGTRGVRSLGFFSLGTNSFGPSVSVRESLSSVVASLPNLQRLRYKVEFALPTPLSSFLSSSFIGDPHCSQSR